MKYCLIGSKISHSYSYDIHNLMGVCYDLNEVRKDEFLNFVKNNDYDGFNITVPYKCLVKEALDEIDDLANAIGSVNTVVKENGKLIGYNTDVLGMRYAFKKNGVDVKKKKVAVLGSGGTARTAEFLCMKLGAKKIYEVSRTGVINYSNYVKALKNCSVIINTTPIGTTPNLEECLIDLSKLKKVKFVYDCIYNPFKTKLLCDAERLRIPYANGIDMLCYQALKSEELWGLTPKKSIGEIVYEINKKKSSVILYGMTSAGKTTVGFELSLKLHKSFYDTDMEFVKINKLTPESYIEKYGEEQFRNAETKIIKGLSTIKGAVIALGGGAVLREENVELLRHNGILVQIKRDAELLMSEGRPLLQVKGAKALYKERKHIYDAISPIYAYNNGEVKTCVEEVEKIYENYCR